MRGTHRYQRYGARTVRLKVPSLDDETQRSPAPARQPMNVELPKEAKQETHKIETSSIPPEAPQNPGKRLLTKIPEDLWPPTKRRKAAKPTSVTMSSNPATLSDKQGSKSTLYPKAMRDQIRFLAEFAPSYWRGTKRA